MEIQKRRNGAGQHLETIKRRLHFLRTRIDASPGPREFSYDVAEMQALEWALLQIARAKPQLCREHDIVFRHVNQPLPARRLFNTAQQLQKHFTATEVSRG